MFLYIKISIIITFFIVKLFNLTENISEIILMEGNTSKLVNSFNISCTNILLDICIKLCLYASNCVCLHQIVFVCIKLCLFAYIYLASTEKPSSIHAIIKCIKRAISSHSKQLFRARDKSFLTTES